MKCVCCEEEVRAVDVDAMCFGCTLVQQFAIIIQKRTDVAGDEAVDLASHLADMARNLILEARSNHEVDDFFADVGIGMVRAH
jgi:hypothetical protein